MRRNREERNKSVLGQSFIFTPDVIDDIHIKAELGRYRMRGMSLFKKIPSWDDLTFMPGTLTRFVIEGYREKCETRTIIGPRAKRPLDLDIPIYITGMSFGALSYEAKTALARGATMAGTATCSGEGGMIPDERRYSEKWFYQCIQSRYGFNPHHLRLADGCEFFIGQGCKVGLGGHLMGQKVTDQVAEMRSLPAGIDQRSPARHPDWLGPDDLSLKIQEIREATNGEIPIQLKLGAARVYDDVRMAAKTDPDSIYMDGMEGSTGAGPHLATEETGVPGIAAIRQQHAQAMLLQIAADQISNVPVVIDHQDCGRVAHSLLRRITVCPDYRGVDFPLGRDLVKNRRKSLPCDKLRQSRWVTETILRRFLDGITPDQQ